MRKPEQRGAVATAAVVGVFLLLLLSIVAIKPKQPVQQPAKFAVWVYPDAGGALNAVTAEKPAVTKIEWLHVGNDGKVAQINQSDDLPNGFNDANLHTVKQASPMVLTTVSGSLDAPGQGAALMLSDPGLRTQAVQNITDFVASNGLAGADIDFEHMSARNPTDVASYPGYLDFLTELAVSLHQHGAKLSIDVPPIDSPATAPHYVLKYHDLLATGVDEISLMAYDRQYDVNGGAVTPDNWLTDVLTYAGQFIPDKSKITIGLPAYGYMIDANGNIALLGTTQRLREFAKRNVDVTQATRDPGSQELSITLADGTTFWWPDQQTLAHQIELVKAKGYNSISIWYAGDQNPWPTASPSSSPTATQ